MALRSVHVLLFACNSPCYGVRMFGPIVFALDTQSMSNVFAVLWVTFDDPHILYSHNINIHHIFNLKLNKKPSRSYRAGLEYYTNGRITHDKIEVQFNCSRLGTVQTMLRDSTLYIGRLAYTYLNSQYIIHKI